MQAGFQTQASPVSGICSANNEMNGALILSGLWATNMSSLWNIPGDRWASVAFRGYLTRGGEPPPPGGASASPPLPHSGLTWKDTYHVVEGKSKRQNHVSNTILFLFL